VVLQVSGRPSITTKTTMFVKQEKSVRTIVNKEENGPKKGIRQTVSLRYVMSLQKQNENRTKERENKTTRIKQEKCNHFSVTAGLRWKKGAKNYHHIINLVEVSGHPSKTKQQNKRRMEKTEEQDPTEANKPSMRAPPKTDFS
jgi:hypothetical protein